ncbi:hypothetical protein DPMN_001168 [Dreissena polymorpha]|uniref:Uncharacterized protein n=1 Tax=Dreissena polymorpha TaxID=45954 RepID=A0A9D4RSP4_DREPO|nr:hypothetical protein DPMN_001168 [Dreissena polymorpha]
MGDIFLVTKIPNLHHDGIEEHNLGVDANCAESTDVLQLLGGCSCLPDAGSDVCSRSPMVVHNASEICEDVYIFQLIALVSDGCASGCVRLEHLVLPYVDGKTQSSLVVRNNVGLFLHLLLGVGEKRQIVGKVEVLQLFPECPLDSVSRLVRRCRPLLASRNRKRERKHSFCFLFLPDDVGDLFWHSVVSQWSPEGTL